MNDDLSKNAFNKAESHFFLVGTVRVKLPTKEEIDLIIEQNLPLSEEYQKYSEKEKMLILAATKAGAKWFCASLIEGNFR